MKKYLLIALVLHTLILQGNNNPFELQKNLEKIDYDQEVLLSALQKIEGDRDEFAEEEEKKLAPLQIIVPRKSMSTVEAPSANATASASNNALMKRLRENLESNDNTVQDDDIVKQGIENERKNKIQKAQDNLELLREKQIKLEEKKIEKLRISKIEKEKREIERIEAEKREVAAYEAARLAKKNEKIRQEKKAKLETKIRKEALVQKRLMEEEESTRIADINFTKEAMIEFLEGDKAYLQAVQEMN